MAIYDYTLCYSAEDGKFHIGIGCGEHEEKFIGEVTDQIADVAGYEGNGSTLILKDFAFETSAEIAVAVPNGTKIVFEGENSIIVDSDKADANVAVLYSSGDMILSGNAGSKLLIDSNTTQGFWSRAICARAGDLTIEGGNITAKAKSARKNCGVYAGGHLWIDTGDKGKINILGGHLTISAAPNAVRAAEGRLTVKEGAKVLNCIETQGTEAFTGDCLSPADREQNL